MEADDQFGSVGDSGDGGDRERRGVRPEDHVVVDDLVEVGEDVLFDVHVLECRLDDQVRGREVRQFGRAFDPVDDRVCLALLDCALRDEATQAILDRVEPVLDELILDVPHHHVVALHARDLGDTTAHRAGADHTDGVY